MKSSFFRSVSSSKARSPVPSSTSLPLTSIIDLSTMTADFPSCSLNVACLLFKTIRYKVASL